MFFLQNLVWGAQVVLLSGHLAALGFSGQEIGYVSATGSLGAILSPLIGGWLADRFLPGQVFAGICYLLCAPVLWLAWGQTEFLPLLAAMFVFSVLHMPTAAVTNAIAFTHLRDTRLFGRARVWGSIGWVGISWSLSAYLRLWEGWNPAQSHLGDGLLVAAVLALVMGLYCFFLPSTPPVRGSRNPLAFLEAFVLLRQRNFAVLFGTAFLVSVMSPFSQNFSFIFFTDAQGGPGLAPSTTSWVLSLGQLLEIPIMPFLGVWITRLGMKRIIVLGVLAQALRSLVLALGQPLWLLVVAQGLNSLFIVCFIVAAMVVVERLSPNHMRAQAQGLLVLALRGLGPLCGHVLAGRVYDCFALANGSHAWPLIFLIPAVASSLIALLFFALFRDDGD
ncbi:MAG: nucleoside transporter [Candidatus Latescibacterota bacterium]|jgi:nucleoside transporter